MTFSNLDILDLFREKKIVNICAPMVRYSKLQFRNLIKEYDCDLAFTPMILADSFCQSEKARISEFSTNSWDSPVVAQFAAKTVHDFVGAAHLISPYCNGVDLNCGCPQRWAKCQGIGCIMLDKPELISDLVRRCRGHISKPFTVSVKMRILGDIKKTVSICQQLEMAGVSFLTIHGRTANQQSVGPVNIESLKLISESVRCPVIANGGVKTLDDVIKLRRATNCKGVMVASNLLINPSLFTGAPKTPVSCIKNWVDICYNSTLDLQTVQQYNANKPTQKLPIFQQSDNLTFQCFHHHLVFMLEKQLSRYVRTRFNNYKTFDSVLEFLCDEYKIVPEVFPVEKFMRYKRMNINYENRNDKYLEFKEIDDCLNVEPELSYNPDLSDGNFFNCRKMHRVEYDSGLSDLFKE